MEVLEPDDIRELVSDWRTHLRAKNRADSTIAAYLESVAMLVDYLDDEELSMVATEVGRRELERYFEYLRQRPNFRTGASLAHSYIAKQYRHLQQFYRWLDDVEEIIDNSPFYKMEVPQVPDGSPDVLRDAELKALLATTAVCGWANWPRCGWRTRWSRSVGASTSMSSVLWGRVVVRATCRSTRSERKRSCATSAHAHVIRTEGALRRLGSSAPVRWPRGASGRCSAEGPNKPELARCFRICPGMPGCTDASWRASPPRY